MVPLLGKCLGGKRIDNRVSGTARGWFFENGHAKPIFDFWSNAIPTKRLHVY